MPQSSGRRLSAGDLPPEQWVEAYERVCSDRLRRSGREWNGPCPVCGGEDRFHIAPGAVRGTVVGCRHGCQFQEIARALFGGGDPLPVSRVPSPPATAPRSPPSDSSAPKSAPAPVYEVPPPPPQPFELDELYDLWPYKKALAVFRYPGAGGWKGEVHEVKFLNRKNQKDTCLCRPTGWGLVYGLTASEYHQGRDQCWRKVNNRTPPEARRRRITDTRAGLYRPGDPLTAPERRPDMVARARESGDWILAVEGPKDADTAAALGLLATTSVGGASGLRDYQAAELEGLRVAVIGDHDKAGIDGLRKRAKLIHQAGAREVRMLEPLGGKPDSGYDLTDWVEERRGGGAQNDAISSDLRRLIDECAPWLPPEERVRETARRLPPPLSGQPEVEVTTREEEVASQALAILVQKERNFYQRSGSLVHVVQTDSFDEEEMMINRPLGSPIIHPLTEPRLRELLAQHCQFVRKQRVQKGDVTEEHTEPAHPPRWAVQALLARRLWRRVSRLETVVEAPVLRPDGSVLQEPGYDKRTGILYIPNTRFEAVPDEPTRQDVDRALGLLREVVCDFPFRKPEHQSAWLSSLLTPLARTTFRGPSPVNLIDANVRGAGKSLLADAVAMLLTGRDAARMSYTRNEEELRKAVTSIAMGSNSQIVLIDNIRGHFGDATLDRALTSGIWRDRLLGKNVDVEIPLQVTWYATGNNIILSGDLARRCLHIRLESEEERPENRSPDAFRHHPLLPWLEKERGRILPAALTLLRAWWAAGQPRDKLSGWGSFDGWSQIVRPCLVWLDLPDPADTREDLEDSAEVEACALASLILGLEEFLRLPQLNGQATAAEILRELERADNDEHAELRQALADLVPRLKPGQLPSTRQLGVLLRRHRGRYVDGACLTQARPEHKTTVWAVRRRRTNDSDIPF